MISASIFGSVEAFGDKDSTKLKVFLIYSSPNESCDMQEIEESVIFEQIIKQYFDKFVLDKQVIMNSICSHIDEINFSTYPLLLQKFNMQRPDLLIFVGVTEINDELVEHDDAMGLWGCLPTTSDGQCSINLISVCADCKHILYPDVIETHIWTMSHEISHFFTYDRHPGEFTESSLESFAYVYEGVHNLQAIYDACTYLEQFEPCEGMSFNLNVNGKLIPAMNFDYILKNAEGLAYFDTSVFVLPESEPTSESIVTSTESTFLPSELIILGLYADGKFVGYDIMIEEGETIQFVGLLVDERNEPIQNSVINIVDKQTGILQMQGATNGVGNFIIFWKTKANLDNLVDGKSDLEFVATGQVDSKTVTSEAVWLTVLASTPTVELPDWIKNNAAWWSAGMIKDSDFGSGIEFMIKEKLVQIPLVESEEEKSSFSVGAIPDWVKLNAKWWSQGELTDDEFTKAIEFLVKEGIIKIQVNI